MKRILVPTDFSNAAKAATAAASLIAQKDHLGITLLHVQNSETSNLLKKANKEGSSPESYLVELCDELKANSGLDCTYGVVEGSIFNEINLEASMPEYCMIVIGTHGTKGLRQNLFGADILKIAKGAPIPMLAVPENFSWPEAGDKIVFPFGGHLKFENKTKAAAFVANALDAEVLIYSIRKGHKALSSDSQKNINNTREHFENTRIQYSMVEADADGFSLGFAKQTLEFAKSKMAPIIAVMSTPSKELSAISSSDKETLINNHEGIAILLTSDY